MPTLPLFPLNTVLFPGMPLTLHIFEERYKLMINRCLDAETPFGVVLLKSGAEVQGTGPTAEPYLIGCTALITQVQRIGMGRMNIVAVGMDRFKVKAFDYTETYLSADVDLLPLIDATQFELRRHDTDLRPWVERYLSAIAKSENVQFDRGQLPDDTLKMTYLAAALLRVAADDKQALLGINSGRDLVQRVAALYRKEATLLKVLLSQSEVVSEGGIGVFSLN